MSEDKEFKEKTHGIDVWEDATYFLYDKETGEPHVDEEGQVIVYRKSGYIQHTKADGIEIDELENVLYRGRRKGAQKGDKKWV